MNKIADKCACVRLYSYEQGIQCVLVKGIPVLRSSNDCK